MFKSVTLSKHSLKSTPFLINGCKAHQLAQEKEVKYPPIIDFTLAAKLQHQRRQWYDSIKALPTIEQKLLEIVSKRSYFSRTYRISACAASYSGVPFQSYLTRTHVIEGLPEKLKTANVEETYSNLKTSLCNIIESGLENSWHQEKFNDVFDFRSEEYSGNRLISNLISFCFRTLASEHPHLLSAAIDHQPDVSSYWYHGGFDALKNYIIPEDMFANPFKPWERETIYSNKQLDAENLCFQYKDIPYYAIRVKEPLPPILPMDDPLCTTAEVVDYNYLPKVFGIPFTTKYYINCLPGVWPNEPCEFPFLQIYTPDKMKRLLSKLKYHNVQDIENGLGVMSSFAWLNGLATFQGFSSYQDLTYPMVGQTILTDGQEWNFYVYQLNTMSFHADTDTKDRRNLCWCSGKMNLFETVENGQIKGLNEDVLKTLLKFVMHAPAVPQGVLLKPYMGEDTRTEEEVKTCHDALRKLYRNAFDPKAFQHEIPMWVRVYKRNHLAPPSPTIKLK